MPGKNTSTEKRAWINTFIKVQNHIDLVKRNGLSVMPRGATGGAQ